MVSSCAIAAAASSLSCQIINYTDAARSNTKTFSVLGSRAAGGAIVGLYFLALMYIKRSALERTTRSADIDIIIVYKLCSDFRTLACVAHQ